MGLPEREHILVLPPAAAVAARTIAGLKTEARAHDPALVAARAEDRSEAGAHTKDGMALGAAGRAPAGSSSRKASVQRCAWPTVAARAELDLRSLRRADGREHDYTTGLEPGGQLTVVLSEIASTGFSWEIEEQPGFMLVEDRDELEPPEDPEICGSEQKRVLVFERAAGQEAGQIRITQRRPWERGSDADDPLVVRISVQ